MPVFAGRLDLRGDKIALGYTPGAGLRCFAIARRDGYGHQTAGQLSPAQKVHYRPADARRIHDQRGSPAELGACDQTAYMLDYGWIVGAERQALQVAKGTALDRNPIVSDQAAADGDFGSLQYGDSRGIVDLAQVEAGDVFDGDDARMREVFDGTLWPWEREMIRAASL